MTQVQMPKFACSHICTDCFVKQILVTAHLYCIIHPCILPLFTVRFGSCSVVREVCRYDTFNRPFKHHWRMAGSWKNTSGVLESPGNFF